MKQSQRAWFDKFSTIVAHYRLRRTSSDHSIFVRHFSADTIILPVYVDVIGDDHQGIIQLKICLISQFHMKDLDLLMYFIGIEVARSLKGLFSQRKYLTDLLEETGAVGSKSIDTPMDLNIHFDQNLGESLANPEKYKQFIGKLIYLIVTRRDIHLL